MQHRYIHHAVPPRSSDDWFRHVFGAKAALDGGVVRRKVKDMERMVGRDRFRQEIARRGFTAVENGDQVIIFCNALPVRKIAGPDPNFQRKFADKASSRL